MSRITTEEQDGWAYVATSSETYAQWERRRQRLAARQRSVERDRALETLRTQGRLNSAWHRV